ncbi:MAG: HPr kinase/phosphatase C-terminal domain-containing protein [Parasphingorhabdus sp.]|uniref:HPr kinase/phosphorylase n=1 Tax=Parasphingorhabdus sp. TaxID=2709688 RepID=UPI0032990D7A
MNEKILHATAVSIGGDGLLITGPSGAGKSDLALRLIDRGATLISDDYVEMQKENDHILLITPATIAGQLEICHLGIFDYPHISKVPLKLHIRLAPNPERFPMGSQTETIMNTPISTIALNSHEPSAPIKAELALQKLYENQGDTL